MVFWVVRFVIEDGSIGIGLCKKLRKVVNIWIVIEEYKREGIKDILSDCLVV